MKHLLWICLVFTLTACGQKPSESQSADAVYMNGKIWTGAGDNVTALAIKDGVIIFSGDDNGAVQFKTKDTEVINLQGKRVVPGFIDNHTHFIESGLNLGQVDLLGVDSKEEFVTTIADYAATLPKGAWVQGGLWDHELWGGELPAKDWIDAATLDNPVFLFRYDGHMAIANSLALEKAGITAATKDPIGGKIVHGTSGDPTGVFKDLAMQLVIDAIPSPSHEDFDSAFGRAQNLALSYGVTQIHDMGHALSSDGFSSLMTFQRVKEREQLNIRVYAFTKLDDWQRLATYVDENGRGDDWLRWGGVKGFVDGSLGSTTAWFYDAYVDEPDTAGIPWDIKAISKQIYGADEAGLQVAIHAIGDRGVDWVLDTFDSASKQNGPRDRRFRIEHAQHFSPDAVATFKRIGAIASMQPYHAIDDGRWAVKRIGEERIKRSYAWRSILDGGGVLTFGSDWNVATLDPIQGIFAATSRQTTDGANPNGWVPEQIVTMEETLNAYTSANAYAGFQDNKLGLLKVGYFADFVVLSDDILTVDPEAIKTTKVLRTVIGGEVRYVAK